MITGTTSPGYFASCQSDCWARLGEKLEDLASFHPERMAGRILGLGDVVGLVEQAQEKISENEAQAAYEKMVLGSFTLEDMLAQIRMFRRLGPMKKVLGMLPGMSGLVDQIDVDDKKMNRLDALFTSMPPYANFSSRSSAKSTMC